MKKLLLASVLAIASFPGYAHPLDGFEVDNTCAITQKTTALRDGPGKNYKAVVRVAPLEYLEIGDTRGATDNGHLVTDWLLAAYWTGEREGSGGWVYIKDIKLIPCSHARPS